MHGGATDANAVQHDPLHDTILATYILQTGVRGVHGIPLLHIHPIPIDGGLLQRRRIPLRQAALNEPDNDAGTEASNAPRGHGGGNQHSAVLAGGRGAARGGADLREHGGDEPELGRVREQLLRHGDARGGRAVQGGLQHGREPRRLHGHPRVDGRAGSHGRLVESDLRRAGGVLRAQNGDLLLVRVE